MGNIGKALYVEIETTKYTKYTKKGLHVRKKPEGYAPEHNVLGNTQNTQKKHCQRKKPQNTQNTQKKDCMWRGNHEILEILEKGLRKVLPAWEESTENTEYTEKHCMWEETTEHTDHTKKTAGGEGNHKILKIHQKALRAVLPAWVSRSAQPHSYEWCRRVRRHPASSAHPLLP